MLVPGLYGEIPAPNVEGRALLGLAAMSLTGWRLALHWLYAADASIHAGKSKFGNAHVR